MRKVNVIVIAGLLALAAVLGTVAATRTVSLGASARQATAASVQSRAKRLDAFEASLHRALDREAAGAARRTRRRRPPQPARRVVYHRPPPVVVVTHTHHGDDGGYEREGGGDD